MVSSELGDIGCNKCTATLPYKCWACDADDAREEIDEVDFYESATKEDMREAVAFAVWCYLWTGGESIGGAGRISEMRERWFDYFRPFTDMTCWGKGPVTCPHCVAQDVYSKADLILSAYTEWSKDNAL